MSFFKTEETEGTAIVRINRAPLNSLISEMLEEGAEIFSALASDQPEKGVILTGEGEHFTCGMDTKAAATFDAADRDRAIAAINVYCASLHRLPCALVIAINGNTIGAGGIMALAGDWVVAARGDYKIGLPEAKAGLPFPPVPQVVLDHWLDPVWRRRLALSSQLLSPEEAIAAGLADELVAPDALIGQALDRAKGLSSQPGFRACKRQLRQRANDEIDAILAS